MNELKAKNFGGLLLALILAGIFVYSEKVNDLFLRFPEIKDFATGLLEDELQDITQPKVLNPPPLRSSQTSPSANLTQDGIIFWTNQHRIKNGFPELKENSELNAAALAKAEDMLDRQYFAHVSPTGEDASILAKSSGYEFIVIGENLAQGNFSGDADLVQAWMDSPGHRENILNSRYQDIGVAATRGRFEGTTTWLAVQIFGLPFSACPQPDLNLKNQIETNERQLNELQENLRTLRQEIENMSPKRGSAYNQKVEEYNALAEKYNELIRQTQGMISKYNVQVSAFNECVVLQ